jgi:HPt (histidine-containing phosphotransfer) domain-containing protein
MLSMLSHSLKGSSALLRIESIAFICREIEESAKKSETYKYSELVEKLKKEAQKIIEDYNKWIGVRDCELIKFCVTIFYAYYRD